MGDLSSSFPGTGGQFPSVPQPTGIGLPAVPGVPNSQFPSIGGVPPQMLPPGMTGLPSGQIPVSVLPAVGSTTPDLPSGGPSGLPVLGGSFPGGQTPGLPSASFPTGIPTPGLASQGALSNIGTAQGLPGIPTSSTPSGIAGMGTGQLPLPRLPASQGPSATGLPNLELTSTLGANPGIPGMSLPGLPSGIPSEPAVPQISSVGLPTGISIPGLAPQVLSTGIGNSQGLPELPTGSALSGIAGTGSEQLPLPGRAQLPGIPTSSPSFGGMTPPSSVLSVPGTRSLGEGGYGAMIPGTQVNPGMVPPGSSQVPGIPTDLASAGGMVPISTAKGFSGTPGLGEKGYGAMIPSSEVNSGMVPQGGFLPSSTGMPTGAQYPGDTPLPPYAGEVNDMGAQQLQQMGLPSTIPNPDLLVRGAFCNSDLKVL